MELYIKIMFWVGLINLIINLAVLSTAEFPRTQKETMGLFVAKILVGAAFFAWAGSLVYF